jgi:hypothetical protein
MKEKKNPDPQKKEDAQTPAPFKEKRLGMMARVNNPA